MHIGRETLLVIAICQLVSAAERGWWIGEGKPMNEPEKDLASIDERLRHRFESAWREGQPERIEDCLPSETDPRYLGTLEKLIHIDLEFAWKASSAVKNDETAESAETSGRLPGAVSRVEPGGRGTAFGAAGIPGPRQMGGFSGHRRIPAAFSRTGSFGSRLETFAEPTNRSPQGRERLGQP